MQTLSATAELPTPYTDLAHCRQTLSGGSRSFWVASQLLPPTLRNDACGLYAFCREADDLIDEGEDAGAALALLRVRLDAIYQQSPGDRTVDRVLARIVAKHQLPRALLEALLEGFAWDASGRHYQTLSEVYAYGARVAGVVGVMMAVLMGVRSPQALARAADLGVAMQLTNIARDVGEDARAGRLYLPRDLLEAADIDPDAFLRNPLHRHWVQCCSSCSMRRTCFICAVKVASPSCQSVPAQGFMPRACCTRKLAMRCCKAAAIQSIPAPISVSPVKPDWYCEPLAGCVSAVPRWVSPHCPSASISLTR